MEQIFLTPEQAISTLLEGDYIHTFRNPNGMMLGCDWKRKDIINLINENPNKIELGGDTCRGMKHGLIIHSDGILFIECDDSILGTFDLESNN